MRRLICIGLLAVVALALAGCGGQTTYTLAASKTCLTERGAKISGTLDFVAQTANGGAFVTQLGGNYVSVLFGVTVADAKQLELAYERLALPNVRAGLSDVLRRYNNSVTLWHEHPSDSDLALVVGCLR
ncbi:MAG: hypothetical protein WCH31_05555 [Actinomycetes bacterium]